MTNADSRFATMQAMKDEQSFKINSYKNWTVDWSYRKGDFYSNKAPGPMLLAFPIYLLIKGTYDILNPEKSKGPPSSSIRAMINLLSQVLPIFFFLIFVLAALKKERDLTDEGVFWGTLLFLFGTTASLFFNSFFGHGMAALFSYGICFFLYNKNYQLTGLFFGLAVLCDYAAALFILPLIFAIPLRRLSQFCLGGIIPGILWCCYHIPVTGSIFVTPNKFINPIFKDSEVNAFWGAIALPNIKVAGELIFGMKRGILITQPWVLLYLPFMALNLFKPSSSENNLRRVVFIAFILIFLLNTSFNGWHGGASAGPRYLSVGLSAMCFTFILDWKLFSQPLRKLFLVLISYTLLFKTLTLMTSALVSEDVNLIGWMVDFLINKAGAKQYVRAPIFLGLIGYSYYLFIKNSDKNKAPSTSF